MSTFSEKEKIWFSGQVVDWKDATVHVMSHVLHYGSAVFEGLRCYETERGPAIFRLKEHVRRLFNSAKIYRMTIPFTQEEIFQATVETVKINNLRTAYIRPIAFRGYDSLGVDPANCPIELVIATMDWGKYLGEEAISIGVDVRISSWNRMSPNTLPAMAKCGANYMNSQLIKLEAMADGYIEGIALDMNGYVSEGSGENIFVVYEGEILTPPLATSILPGITRDTVVVLAEELGYVVKERQLPRELLYLADEVFFTGSAAEISPIKSIDRIPVGRGYRGPVTEELQSRFFDILETGDDGERGWMTFVYED